MCEWCVKYFCISCFFFSVLGDLKTLLTAQMGIPTCHQGLEGWKQYPNSDFTTLASLNLPRENILFLTIPDMEDGELSTEE